MGKKRDQRRADKADRREARQERKQTRADRKDNRRAEKTARKAAAQQARSDRQATRQAGRSERQERRAETWGRIGEAFGGAAEAALGDGGLLSNLLGGDSGDDPYDLVDEGYDPTALEPIDDDPWYTRPAALIGGGIAAAAGLALILLR